MSAGPDSEHYDARPGTLEKDLKGRDEFKVGEKRKLEQRLKHSKF